MSGLRHRDRSRRAVVLTSGVFDLLHLGHVRFLEAAKKVGSPNAKLVVVVARDTTVRKRKNMTPIMSEDQRRSLVESLKVVDLAILGEEGFNMEKVIQKTHPDIIALGYDQIGIEEAVRDLIAKKKLRIEVVRIDKFGEDELASSSEIKRKIVEDLNRD